MHGVVLVLLGWLLSAMPAQSRAVSRIVMEHHDDACTGLDSAQCCAQMLEIAAFRATGDQVPRATKTPLRLSCADPDRVFAQNACQMIALSRGFSAREAGQICTPGELTKRCHGDSSCKQCMTDLDKLEWKAPQRACYALTYVPKTRGDGTKVVTIGGSDGSDARGGQAVRVRRYVVR